MEENTCKWNNWQGINLQNIQTAHVAPYQKNPNNPTKKLTDLNKTFLQRRNTDSQKAHEKMLNITNY